MKISARVDYGLQAILEIVANSEKSKLVTAEEIATRHELPLKFLEGSLATLKRAEIIGSKRGPDGGYEMSSDPKKISVADIFRIIDGPLAAVKGKAPESARYKGANKNLTEVWIVTRVGLREILENISIYDVYTGKYSPRIKKLLDEKDAWARRK